MEDQFQAFVDQVGWVPGSEALGEFVTMVEITDNYFNSYAEKTNTRKYDSAYIGVRMSRLGFEPSKKGKLRGRWVLKSKSETNSGNPLLKVLK
jgi:hypothetical protein